MRKTLWDVSPGKRPLETVFQQLGKKCQPIEKEDLKIDDPLQFILIFSTDEKGHTSYCFIACFLPVCCACPDTLQALCQDEE